jgi:hypothetical protein
MNEVGDVVGAGWWNTLRKKYIGEKWRALTLKRTGIDLADDDIALAAVMRLNEERNQVAHHRGLKHGDSYFRSGPPVDAKGGISPIRAYYDAARAIGAVNDAERAFLAL